MTPESKFQRLKPGQGVRQPESLGAAAAARGDRGHKRPSRRPAASKTAKPVRGRQQPVQPLDRRHILIVAALATVVIVVLGVIGFRALHSQGEAVKPQMERKQSAVEEKLSFNDHTYSLAKSQSGTWELFAQREDQGSKDGDKTLLMQLEGTPVQLILYDGGLLIPENLPNGSYKVISYTLADGSVPSTLLNLEGKPVSGKGTIKTATLDGDRLVLDMDQQGAIKVDL